MDNVDLRDMPHESAEDLNKHLISRSFYDSIYNSYENFIRGNNSDFPELKKKMSTLINFCMWGDLMFVDLLFVTALGDVQPNFSKFFWRWMNVRYDIEGASGFSERRFSLTTN